MKPNENIFRLAVASQKADIQ